MKNKHHPNLSDEFTKEWIAIAGLPARPEMPVKYEQGLKDFRAEMAKIMDHTDWIYQDYLASELHANWNEGMFERDQLWKTSEREAARKMRQWIYCNKP